MHPHHHTSASGVVPAVPAGHGPLRAVRPARSPRCTLALTLALATVAACHEAGNPTGPVSAVEGDPHALAAPAACGRMLAGEGLQPDGFVRSCNGKAMLVLQTDGNVVLYNDVGPVWSAPNTLGKGTSIFQIQHDGNLVAYNGALQPLWASNTAGNPGAWLAIQDDCNLVIYRGPYDQRVGVLWTSNTSCRSTTVGNDYPYPAANAGAVDPWNFYYRQCTSFAAWRIRTRTRATNFTNQYAGLPRWGHATSWDDAARTASAQAAGVSLHAQPAVGRIAQWEAGYNGGAATYGHVAYVAEVYSDGSILVEEYNYTVSLGYGTRRIYPGSSRWPSLFIQF